MRALQRDITKLGVDTFLYVQCKKLSKLYLLRIYRYIKVQSYPSLITSVINIKANYPTV
jgi:hypothetical protein